MRIRVTGVITLEQDVEKSYLDYLQAKKGEGKLMDKPSEAALIAAIEQDMNEADDMSVLLDENDFTFDKFKVERIPDAQASTATPPKAGSTPGGGSNPTPGGSKKA